MYVEPRKNGGDSERQGSTFVCLAWRQEFGMTPQRSIKRRVRGFRELPFFAAISAGEGERRGVGVRVVARHVVYPG